MNEWPRLWSRIRRFTLSSALMATVFEIFARGPLRIRLKDLAYFLYLVPIFMAFYAICFWKERPTAALHSIYFMVEM